MSLPQPQVVVEIADSYGQARRFCAARLHTASQSLADDQGLGIIKNGWERLYIIREDGKISMPFAVTQRQLIAFAGKKIVWKRPEVSPRAEELTAYELRAKVKLHQPDSLFFSPNNMAFAGDTMDNYSVAPAKIVKLWSGEEVLAYELLRIRPVKHGLRRSAWFRADNFKLVHVASQEGVPLNGVDLGHGFRAVPAEDVTFNGHEMPRKELRANYSGRWCVISPNGKALDSVGSSRRPHTYESLEDCQDDVDFLLKLGEWSTCA